MLVPKTINQVLFRVRTTGLRLQTSIIKLHEKLRPIFLTVLILPAFLFVFESGHSTEVEIQHCPFMPDMFSLRYLIHGTNEKNLDSIRRLGLLPGGTRGGRNHVHFALDSSLSTLKDVLRTESDCILIARPGAVAGLSPKITHNRYVLTDQTVPFTRFCGVWSFVDRVWVHAPETG